MRGGRITPAADIGSDGFRFPRSPAAGFVLMNRRSIAENRIDGAVILQALARPLPQLIEIPAGFGNTHNRQIKQSPLG